MYSRSQRELAESAKENHSDQRNLDYFRAQLELFSKMCLGRQYLAILKVKEQLPIDVVLRYMYMYVCCTIACEYTVESHYMDIPEIHLKGHSLMYY